MACVLALALHLHGTPEHLLWHEVRVDTAGKLLSWSTSNSPCDDVITRAWNVFKAIPVQPNGYRTYITYPVFYGPNDPGHELFSGREWTHNPASTFAMLTDAAMLYYAYCGDAAVIERIREMLDHHIAHGSTLETDAWACVPYASADPASPQYRGATEQRYQQTEAYLGRGDGLGYLEPDKVGELGLAYLRFYEHTRESKYLEAARRCADALAAHVRPGDESHSPWPFRVDAKTSTHVREEYTANAVGPIRLLDEMIRIGEGDVSSYQRARDIAWKWLLTYPMQNNVWAQYFEDIYIYPDYRTNINQYCALETVRYLLDYPERDPDWRAHAAAIIQWVREHFAADSTTMAGLPEKGIQWGAEVISEQINDMDKMSSHTARYASIMAYWYERTGATGAKEKAFRSFNWATYACRNDGLVKTSLDEGTGYWFSDGYGDYMRHFQRGIASVPEWAPQHEMHLLRSSSIVQEIHYGDNEVVYRTFDPVATERFTMPEPPTAVRQGAILLPRRPTGRLSEDGFTAEPLSNGAFLVHIRHSIDAPVTITG